MRHHVGSSILAVVWGTVGCGAPYSNDIFAEDALFKDALPTVEEVRLDEPAAASRAVAEEPCVQGNLQELSFGTMRYVNHLMLNLLSGVQQLQATPITRRTVDSRGWGPIEEPTTGQWLTLTVERRQVREADVLIDRYFYWMETAETPEGEGHPVVWGEWDPDYGLKKGLGSFTFDQGFFTQLDGDDQTTLGTGYITYDTRTPRRFVSAFLEDLRPPQAAEGTGQDIRAEFEADGEGGGWFTYEQWSNIIQQTPVQEQMEVTTRWLAAGPGRSEGRYADGDLDLQVVSLVECWDAAQCLVYYRDTHGLSEPVGEPGLCAIEDVIIP